MSFLIVFLKSVGYEDFGFATAKSFMTVVPECWAKTGNTCFYPRNRVKALELAEDGIGCPACSFSPPLDRNFWEEFDCNVLDKFETFKEAEYQMITNLLSKYPHLNVEQLIRGQWVLCKERELD